MSASRRPLAVGLAAAALALAALAASGFAASPAVETMAVVFVSIVVEALPFVLIGAAVSAAVAAFVSERLFADLARLPRALQVPGAALAGACFPVCECGSVPVARRLLLRGGDRAAAITFMLAAPVLNPIVLGATWVAYSGRGIALEMTASRAALGLAIAVAVGLAVAKLGGSLLRSPAAAEDHASEQPEPEMLACEPAAGGRAGAFAGHLVSDFLFMGRFLVAGAAVAAMVQTLLPQSVLAGIGGAPVLAVLVMAGLAIALSLCSAADSFVAVSFTAFPVSAQLGFLVVGPVIDAKLAVLYGATFRARFTLILVAVTLPLAVAGSLILGAWVG